MTPTPPQGIYDTSLGQCDAGLVVKGEYFRCDLAVDHDGWSHESKAAAAIWRAGSVTR